MRAPLRAIAPLIGPHLRRHPVLVSAAVLFGVLSTLAEGTGISLFIPLLGALTKEPLRGGGPLPGALARLFGGIDEERRLFVVATCIFAAIAARSLLAYATRLSYATLDARVGDRLRSAIYDRFLGMDYGQWERAASDRMFNVLATESWRASSAVVSVLSLIVTLCTLGIYALALLLVSVQLTVFVSLALLGFSLVARHLTRRSLTLGALTTRVNAVLAKRMVETFEGMKVIRSFGREPYERARFRRASARVSRLYLRTRALQSLVGPVLELSGASLLVGLLLCSYALTDNLAVMLVFLLMLQRLQPRVREANEGLVTLDSLRAPLREVSALLQRDAAPCPPRGARLCLEIREGLQLNGVSYRHAPSAPNALDDVTLSFPFGETTALVGPSGAGKSTLIKLLLQLYAPSHGSILLDGIPLAEFTPSSLRARMAVVSQDIFLFEGTVRYNIAYGRPDATNDEIVEAARQAGADEFIRAFPSGYDERVGSRGSRLSGGQQQRVTLARAILMRPDLLILDEATNALDSIAEDVVQRALAALRGRCAIVIVAHRLATIEQADNIVVLDSGKVCEQGSFAELVERGGLFARLYELQSRERRRRVGG